MTTDTFTLSRHALEGGDDLVTSTRPLPSTGTDGRSVARPRRTGAGPMLRRLLSGTDQQPAADPLFLLGPNGGPLWTIRMH